MNVVSYEIEQSRRVKNGSESKINMYIINMCNYICKCVLCIYICMCVHVYINIEIENDKANVENGQHALFYLFYTFK